VSSETFFLWPILCTHVSCHLDLNLELILHRLLHIASYFPINSIFCVSHKVRINCLMAIKFYCQWKWFVLILQTRKLLSLELRSRSLKAALFNLFSHVNLPLHPPHVSTYPSSDWTSIKASSAFHLASYRFETLVSYNHQILLYLLKLKHYFSDQMLLLYFSILGSLASLIHEIFNNVN